VAERVENPDSARSNLKNLILQQQRFAVGVHSVLGRLALGSATFVCIRVHSWLKRKPQHLNRGGDFDVFVAYDEI
jgi:hypothetical protein